MAKTFLVTKTHLEAKSYLVTENHLVARTQLVAKTKLVAELRFLSDISHENNRNSHLARTYTRLFIYQLVAKIHLVALFQIHMIFNMKE